MSNRPVRRNPENVASPIGKYSHLSIVPPGKRLVFIAGQVGNDADGVLAEGAEEQTVLALKNVEALLASMGATPADLVRLLTFVSGTDSIPGFTAGRDRVFKEWFPNEDYPGHSLAVAAALIRPEIHVELEGWAAVDIDENDDAS